MGGGDKETYGFALRHCQKSYGLVNPCPLSTLLKGTCSTPFFKPGAGRLSRATFSKIICTPIVRTAWIRSEREYLAPNQ